MEDFTYHALKVEGKQGAVVCPRIGTHQSVKINLAKRNPKPFFSTYSALIQVEDSNFNAACFGNLNRYWKCDSTAQNIEWWEKGMNCVCMYEY